ncbi:uncharacterized protein LOC120836658 [Ixodes scapularis]|uniref:uncharacterized protein LOC120836658 n=1 Tax=Ixodes scapularis TaxID=6945 RepID=UPI001A9DEFFB|nr:uncharacterized protein LOC120836658 [Ixodes scapularis]
MELTNLPAELILRIFSYLTQHQLTIIAKVSETWKQLAFDPSLWTEISIDSRANHSKQYTREVLDRALLIRQLDVSSGSVDLETVASCSHHFKLLTELFLPGRALSHHAIPTIFANSVSLSKLSLSGQNILLPNDVLTLEQLPRLKFLITTDELKIHDDVLRQISLSCPTLEYLALNSDHISRRDTWECLARLKFLKCLSVSRISTGSLLHASKSCPTLESLVIGNIWNENQVSVAQSLRGFRTLKSLSVSSDCGDGWFNADFQLPPRLEQFDVPELQLKEDHLTQLVHSCKGTLRQITISAALLNDAALRKLPACINLEEISIYGISGLLPILPLIAKMPRLVSAQVHAVGGAKETIRQLTSIVDILDRSKRGHTRLDINIFCSSQSSLDTMLRELFMFKKFILLNTCLSPQHIRNLEEQWWRLKDAKLFWLPCGEQVHHSVTTSFPAVCKTLRHLTLDIVDA